MFIAIFPCSALNVFYALSINFHLTTLIIFDKEQNLGNLSLPTFSCRTVTLSVLISGVLLTKNVAIADDQVSHPCKKAREIKTLYFKSKYFLFVFLIL